MIAIVRINALCLEFPVDLPTDAIGHWSDVETVMKARLRDEAVKQFKKWMDRPGSGGVFLDMSFPL